MRPSQDAVDVLVQHIVALVVSALPSTAATWRQRLPASGDVHRLVFLLGAAIAHRGRPYPQWCDRRRHCARAWATDRSEAWKWSVEALMETAAALSFDGPRRWPWLSMTGGRQEKSMKSYVRKSHQRLNLLVEREKRIGIRENVRKAWLLKKR